MDVRRILVIGAGTMGHGIAQVAAQSGYEVSLFDAMEGAAAGGLEKVRKSFEKGIEKGKVSPANSSSKSIDRFIRPTMGPLGHQLR